MACESEIGIREEICRIGAMLHQRGYVAACDGNISVRLGQNRVLCTPTSISKGMMTPDDLVLLDMEGEQQNGKRHPSTQLGTHLLLYRLPSHVHALVPAHPA